jgi:hypothetical protein
MVIHALNRWANDDGKGPIAEPRCLGLGGDPVSFATNWLDVTCKSCLQTRPENSSNSIHESGDVIIRMRVEVERIDARTGHLGCFHSSVPDCTTHYQKCHVERRSCLCSCTGKSMTTEQKETTLIKTHLLEIENELLRLADEIQHTFPKGDKVAHHIRERARDFWLAAHAKSQ